MSNDTEKNCLLKPSVFKTLSETAQTIGKFDLSKRLEDTTYAGLAKIAIDGNFKNKAEWRGALRPAELEILAVREKNGEPNLKFKSTGKFKDRCISHNSTYITARDVIGKAIDNGVSLANSDGTPRGKTALEKDPKYKAAGAANARKTTPKSAFERANDGMRMLAKNWGDLSESQREEIRKTFLAMDKEIKSVVTAKAA